MKKILFIFCIFCGLIPTMAFSDTPVRNCDNRFSKSASDVLNNGTRADINYFCYLEADKKTWTCLKASDDGDGCVHNTVVCMIGQYVRENGISLAKKYWYRIANHNCRISDTDSKDSWEQHKENGTDIVPDCDGPRWQKGTGKSQEAFINLKTNTIMNNGKQYIIFEPSASGTIQSIGNICIGYVCDGNKEPCDDGSCGDCSGTSSGSGHPMVDTYLEALGDCDS